MPVGNKILQFINFSSIVDNHSQKLNPERISVPICCIQMLVFSLLSLFKKIE
jgi:hypothetical protein